MATVNKNTANWRLYGGGGLLLGGVLWLIARLVSFGSSGAIVTWLGLLGLLVIGVGLLVVAFGQTGSNGAVGGSMLGKIALVVYAAGWIILGLVALIGMIGSAPPSVLGKIAGVIIIVGGLVAAYVVQGKGVAKGAARWLLFIPAVWGILFVLGALFGVAALAATWVAAILALAFAVTGLAYLLNNKNIG